MKDIFRPFAIFIQGFFQGGLSHWLVGVVLGALVTTTILTTPVALAQDAIPDAMRVPKKMTSSFALPEDDNKLGLFIKGGLAVIIPFEETGYDPTGVRVKNSFETAFAPTLSLGYDFNKNYSVEGNFIFYKGVSSIYLIPAETPLLPTSATIDNYIFTLDQSFHGVSIWQFSFPMRVGIGALFWNNPAPAMSGSFFLLKVGSGLKYNIVSNLSIFSTMDIETRFDYYFLFGDRRNTNVAQGSQLLLTKDVGAGGIGSVIVDFKLGF